ncbi:MAG TPA: DNA primase [Egibacteraceae bacterium]|nr:DNA primase [Egibacteraceae bacterium]
MAGRINDDDIQALRERADIAAVVGDHTALKRAGARLKGLCPFHQEQTPSFTVDQAQGLFHCFGCGEGGDVYAFLQKAEALTFPEAVERLARMVGFQLRYEELSPGQRKALGRRTRLTEALQAAAAFYVERFRGADGDRARAYLGERGLSGEQLEHFGVGWAPDAWDELARHLGSVGFSAQEITDAGLATEGRQGGLIDRFRGRVIFPIFDAAGKDVVAFGGRVLPDAALATGGRDGTPPKYINSPETAVYRKSQTLYALNWARAEIQRCDSALVVEGYMDVIGLHAAGVRHAVATCGTALTAEHLRLLQKFARRVVLALDADEAGFAAADRARSLAEEVEVREVGVLPLPDGKDPADLARAGHEAVKTALDATKTAVEFQIEYLLRTADVRTPEGQVDAYRRTFPLLGRLDDRMLRYRYVRDIVAPAVHLSADLIERELDAAVGARDGQQQRAPAARRQRADGAPLDPQLQLERVVLQAALQHPELLPPGWKQLTEDDFTAAPSRQLFAVARADSAGTLDSVLSALPDDDARGRVRALALAEATVAPQASKIAEMVARLRAATLSRRIADLKLRLARLNEQLDAAERRDLGSQLFQLERQRRDLLEGRDA